MPKRGFRFYTCMRCGYVRAWIDVRHSVIPHYCPRESCGEDMFWNGPFNTLFRSLSGYKLKAKR